VLALALGTRISRANAPQMTALITLAVAGSVLLILAARDGTGLVSRFLSVRPLRWIGDRSYGMYLYHLSATYLVTRYLVGGYLPDRILVVAPLTLLTVCLAAWASRRWVEEPIRQAVVRRTTPRDDPAQAPPHPQQVRTAA
jgi:peptidoglycan/LPS O-acetylase OafA/YrhL